MAINDLLISSIEDVQVVQIEESKISVKNKKAESEKPSNSDGNPFETSSGGENKTVDLGAGARKYTIKVISFDIVDIDRLEKILYTQRFCTITDKFRGKLSVYIDEYETTRSEKHIGKTVFVISATIQDIEKAPIINAKAQLEKVVKEVENKLNEKIYEFIGNLKSVSGYIDESLSTVEKGMENIIDLEFTAVNSANAVRSKVNRLNRLNDTLKIIKELPEKFIELVGEVTGTETQKKVEIFFSVTSTGIVVQNLSEFVSEDGVINVTNTALSNLSQIELRELQKTVDANEVLNLVSTVMEMKQILTKEYLSKEDFDAQVDLTILRLGVTNLSSEQIIIARQSLKQFSNQTLIKGLIDYEVETETPLTNVIYGIYGNLDFYVALRDINNFKDNDAVIGTVKVYEI